MKILRILGLTTSPEDLYLKDLVENSYQSLRVVGRGTVKIDPSEVNRTEEIKKAREEIKTLFACNYFRF